LQEAKRKAASRKACRDFVLSYLYFVARFGRRF
jgi:hypothetical protein